MAKYTVLITKSAKKELAKVPEPMRSGLATQIAALADDPRPYTTKTLHGDLKGLFWVRQGDWRAYYSIEDAIVTVTVLSVGHRSKIYDR